MIHQIKYSAFFILTDFLVSINIEGFFSVYADGSFESIHFFTMNYQKNTSIHVC